MAQFRFAVYDPSSPLAAIKALAPNAVVEYLDGSDPALAADRARGADAVIVFATQWMIEGYDAKDLSLPEHQDDLIGTLEAANSNTVVVLETGNPVLTPWLGQAGALLEAWYPGSGGGDAIAAILFGAVNPSGRLPITFPASEAQLPRPILPGADKAGKAFAVDYIEGADVGYRWFQAKAETPLFPFGYGLSYTRFAYSGLSVTGGRVLSVSFLVKNTGSRAGMDTPQVYATPPGGQRRLIGWKKLMLKPGEVRKVSVTAEPRNLARYDVQAKLWRLAGGRYEVAVGASSADLALQAPVTLSPSERAP